MSILRRFAWGGLTLLAILLLAIIAFWIAREATLPSGTKTVLVVQWLLVLAVLVLVAVCAGYLANGRSVGIFIDERNRMSLARVQWIAWFLVLFSSYFTGAIWDAAFNSDLPAIEPNLFALIGITTGSAVISGMVVNVKKNEPSPAVASTDPLIGRMDRNLTVKEASFEDLFLGEEAANRYSVDVSRLQKLIATILLVSVYMEMVWIAFSDSSATYKAFTMPVVGANFVVLLGASHAAYLASKATPKTPSS